MKIQMFISAASLTIATAMFSCTPDIIAIGHDSQQVACTTDAECGQGETCGAGACRTSCVTDAECPSGLSCVSGDCVDGAESSGCIADAECPSGLSCVSGACVTGAVSRECIADADCPSDDFCSKTGFCTHGGGFSCTTDADCPLHGQICGGGTVCEGPGVQACGPEYGECPENYVCIAENCKSTLPPPGSRCVTDADCPWDHFCGKAGICSNGAGSCTTEADCPVDGQACWDGECSGPESSAQSCASDVECPENHVCIEELCRPTP
ncbi:hypothetical protein BE11_46025 [Sorangium cellulosum]|nr:hypothetical protein BE11_46025 [Sorangium cellulosum]